MSLKNHERALCTEISSVVAGQVCPSSEKTALFAKELASGLSKSPGSTKETS